MKKSILIGACLGGIAFAAMWIFSDPAKHGMMHDAENQQDRHEDGGHDELNMPGLIGVNTTDAEVADMRALFTDFTKIARSVENLPNGIKTTTATADDDLRTALVSHTITMIRRIEKGNNPQVPIQSETLSPMFLTGDQIVTDIVTTDTGIIVTQTSNNPEVAMNLQTHAAEVSDLVARGMESVHERMSADHHQ